MKYDKATIEAIREIISERAKNCQKLADFFRTKPEEEAMYKRMRGAIIALDDLDWKISKLMEKPDFDETTEL